MQGEGMNIAICDDQAADAERLRGFLLSHFEANGFTGSVQLYDSGEALLEEFAPGRFDVLFLDVYMKELTGVETAQRIRESDPDCLLVFTTVSDDKMREAFALRAASYVEKPLTPEKLEVVFTQCHNLFMKNARYIEINFERSKLKIPFAQIMYAEITGRQVFFHTSTGEVIKTNMKMNDVERQLPNSFFLRCHRSFIVNMNYVADVQKNDLILKNGQPVPMRINGRKDVVNALNKFLTERLFGGE